MNAAVLVVAATLGQCPPVFYSGPDYAHIYSTSPICSTLPIYSTSPDYSNVVREKVYFSGEVRSRCIAEACLSNGKKITVPVINGYMPSVRVTTMTDGSTLREYDYYDRHVYPGGTIYYGRNPPKVAPRPRIQRVPHVTDSSEDEVAPPPKRPPTVTEERSVVPVPTPKQMPRYTDEDFDAMRSNIRVLEETIRTLKEKSESSERPPITLQADPLPLDGSPAKPPMKKPSEFGRE